MLLQNDRCRFKGHWRHESLSNFFCVIFWWQTSCRSDSPYKNFIVCTNKATGKSRTSQAVKQEMWLVKSKALGKNNSVHQYLVLTRNCFTITAVWECKMHLFGHELVFSIKCPAVSIPHLCSPVRSSKLLTPCKKGVFYSLFPPNKLAIIIQVSSISSIFTKNLILILTFNYLSPTTFTNKTMCQ